MIPRRPISDERTTALFDDKPGGNRKRQDRRADTSLGKTTSRNPSPAGSSIAPNVRLRSPSRRWNNDGLCFCPRQELITRIQLTNVLKTEADDDKAYVEQPEPVVGEGEHADVEEPEKGTDGQDVGSAMDDAASEMEFWLDEVLPEVVDCVKCGNSLKLDDEEKMFGIYGCPYCKANINHSKGEEVLSILVGIEDGEEDKEETPKRKPIKVNFKALRPYAALLVFSAGLIYGVIKASDYITNERYRN